MNEMMSYDVQFNGKRNVDDAELLTNLKRNLGKGVPSLKAGRAVVVGGGPSVTAYIDDIKAKAESGFTIFALNGAGSFLNSHGITPDYLAVYDARPENIVFFDADAKTYLVASYINTEILDVLKQRGKNAVLYHVGCSDDVIKTVRSHEPNAHFLGGGSCIGMQILNVLVMMGFRVAHLYGYDSSAKGEAHHAYSQPMNDQNKKYTFEFQGKYYQAELAMGAQAREFTEIFPKFEKLGLHLEVIGDGLLPDMWRAELDRMRGKSALLSWDDAEREKYTRVWSNPQYRVCSEGEHLVPLFEETCSIKPGDTVLDLGCGCGRASKKLKDAGYGVTAVDIAKNCLDKDVEVPFVEAVLWALPESLTADWAFCCDVMEHIPEEKIDDVLIAINKSCTKGAFFNIAFRESAFEGVLGEKLHLTVRNYHWWIDRLEKHFGDTIHYIEETGVFYSLKKSEEVKLTGLNREICCSGINLDCDLTQ